MGGPFYGFHKARLSLGRLTTIKMEWRGTDFIHDSVIRRGAASPHLDHDLDSCTGVLPLKMDASNCLNQSFLMPDIPPFAIIGVGFKRPLITRLHHRGVSLSREDRLQLIMAILLPFQANPE